MRYGECSLPNEEVIERERGQAQGSNVFEKHGLQASVFNVDQT